MTDDILLNQPGHSSLVLPNTPPFVWPESRIHACGASYEEMPPFEKLMADADLIAGTLVGVTDKTVCWLEKIMDQNRPRKVRLVIVVYPASPTREKHLLSFQRLRDQFVGPEKEIDVRLFPFNRIYDDDYEKMDLMPTILQATSADGKTTLCLGSVGDAGRDTASFVSFNVVFQPDDDLRDSWRRWFQYLLCNSVPLRTDTIRIPHLTPAIGDPAATEMWEAYKRACLNWDKVESPPLPMVDPETGETTNEEDGEPVVPWDGGVTKLDPLAQKLVKVYAQGFIVTIDEATRIKPLEIPVKATLLGQKSERSVGAVKHKQAFNLRVLDESVAKEVEKCRSPSAPVALLSYLLNLGNRWIPDGAKNLLEKELEARNREGKEILKNALGGNTVHEFIKKKSDAIRKDLDEIYRQLNQGTSVPEDKFNIILDAVQVRLTNALDVRFTPRAIYNRFAPPDLTVNAPAENWSQPLSLLLHSARDLRKSLIDSYFPRKFTGMSFTAKEFQVAMDIFGDVILKTNDFRRAQNELEMLKKIEEGADEPKKKSADVLKIIMGIK